MGCRAPSPSTPHPFVSNGQPTDPFLSPPRATKLVEQKLPKGYQAIASMGSQESHKRLRVLCLHGYRTSASILKKQILGRWPEPVTDKLDLDFLDAPFPARGKSDVEGFYDPPYYEWYHSSEDFKEYYNFDESITYIEEHMLNHGPFDGLLGFSQGAMISAALPGMQAQGVAFTKVPKIKFLVLISGAKFAGYKFGQPKLAANAFSSPFNGPSLHLIGKLDFLKAAGTDLLGSFVDPVIIHHPRGHIIPRLDDKGLETMLGFIEKIQTMQSLDH